jgi:hypothetical protein
MTKQIRISETAFATVDDEDYERVSAHKWHALKRADGNPRYARTSMKQPDGTFKCVLMHRFILDAADGALVDHRDGDGLHNIRDNLRSANSRQNASNSCARGVSGLNGVRRLGKDKFLSLIAPRGMEIYLGYYPTPEEAGAVYNAAAVRVYGEFARLNPGRCADEVLDAVLSNKEQSATRLLDEVEELRRRGD